MPSSRFFMLAALGAAACSDPVGTAEQRFKLVKNSDATAASICREHRALQEAYLAANRAADYSRVKHDADVDCLIARVSEEASR